MLRMNGTRRMGYLRSRTTVRGQRKARAGALGAIGALAIQRQLLWAIKHWPDKLWLKQKQDTAKSGSCMRWPSALWGSCCD